MNPLDFITSSYQRFTVEIAGYSIRLYVVEEKHGEPVINVEVGRV